MSKLRRFVALLLSLLCHLYLVGAYAQCASDPGDRNCEGYTELSPNNNINNKYQIAQGETRIITQPGKYYFSLNGGTLIICCQSSDSVKLLSSDYNNGTLCINSGSNVFIDRYQSSTDIVNRGSLEIMQSYDYANINSGKSFINVGTFIVNSGLRVDVASFTNIGYTKVKKDFWLNSTNNFKFCLANHSFMDVDGTSHINSAIYGDGGCYHSNGDISLENNYITNNKIITPTQDLVYLCTSSSFSTNFNYDPNASINKSGGAVLQENCTGCSSLFDFHVSLSDATICEGMSIVLNANVDTDGDYEYSWEEINLTNQQSKPLNVNTSSISVSPTQTTGYRVIVKNLSNSRTETAECKVYVSSVHAIEVINEDSTSVYLTASDAESYLWNTGATTQKIFVEKDTVEKTYYVRITKNGVSCKQIVTVDRKEKEIPINIEKQLKVWIEGPSVVCPNSPFKLKANVSEGSGNYQYIWGAGAANDSVLTSSIQATSQYLVVVRDLDLGIEGQATYTVEIPKVGYEVDANSHSVKVTFKSDNNVTKTLYFTQKVNTILPVQLVREMDTLICNVPFHFDPADLYPKQDTTIEIIQCDSSMLIQKDSLGFDVISVCSENRDNSADSTVCLRIKKTLINNTYAIYLNNDKLTSDTFSVSSDTTRIYNVVAVVNDSIRIQNSIKVKVRKAYLEDTLNGKAHLIATGGSTYQWQVEGTPTTARIEVPIDTVAKTYRVLIDGDCLDSVVVEGKSKDSDVDTSVVHVTLADAVVCEGGNVVLKALVEGDGIYTYSWEKINLKNHSFETMNVNAASLTVTPNTTTGYRVKVTDAAASKTGSSECIVYVLSADLIKKTETKDAADLVATLADSYLWSTGETSSSIHVLKDSVAKEISVTLTKNGVSCAQTIKVLPKDTVVIIPNPDPVQDSLLVWIEGPTYVCPNSPFSLYSKVSGGSGRYSYKWSPETTSSITDQIQATSTYSLIVYDLDLNLKGNATFTVNVPSYSYKKSDSDTTFTIDFENGLEAGKNKSLTFLKNSTIDTTFQVHVNNSLICDLHFSHDTTGSGVIPGHNDTIIPNHHDTIPVIPQDSIEPVNSDSLNKIYTLCKGGSTQFVIDTTGLSHKYVTS